MIVAGFGWRAAARLSSLEAALTAARGDHPPIDALAAPADRMPLLHALGLRLGLPVIAIPPASLPDAETVTRSAASLAARGTGSVSEACALAAMGAGARLLAARHVSPDRLATCAIATGPPR